LLGTQTDFRPDPEFKKCPTSGTEDSGDVEGSKPISMNSLATLKPLWSHIHGLSPDHNLPGIRRPSISPHKNPSNHGFPFSLKNPGSLTALHAAPH
jgi:hypothetical protein